MTVKTRVLSLWFLTTKAFTFKTISVTSSRTFGMELNSCCAPRILIWVIALPSKLDSKTRRRLLPMVDPKPRSKGSAVNLPYVELSVDRSTET
jgi:hypothetical protein